MDLLGKYFTGSMTRLTLYKKLYKVSPHRTYEAMSSKLRHMKRLGWSRTNDDALKKLRVGYLDIETSSLDADFGFMLCWWIKPAGLNRFDHDIIAKKEIHDLVFDRRICHSLLKAFDNYDVLYTHWGGWRRFDLPFIVARAFKLGLDKMLPTGGDKFIMDTWPIARAKLKISRRSLDRIAALLNIKNVKKSYLEPDKLLLARHGCEKSLAWIDDHCKRDVVILERVHKKLAALEKPVYRGI